MPNPITNPQSPQQSQLHPDQLRSSLGFLTNLQEHVLNHQHPELKAGIDQQQAQNQQNSTQNAPETPQTTEPPKDSEASNAEVKEMDTLKKLLEPITKSIEEIKSQLKSPMQEIQGIKAELDALLADEEAEKKIEPNESNKSNENG